MAAAHPQPAKGPRDTHAWAEAQKIKERVDAIIHKMQKDAHFTPTREQLEECAEQILTFINKYHASIVNYERYLKSAVIDLTEVPEMALQMQRISFLTSLRDASKNLLAFLEG